jgi:D-alanine transaminase
MANEIVYLNGRFLPLDEAHISVLDRGFIFGDGIYEVIPVYSRHPFRLTEHLARLQHSLDGVRLTNPHTNAQWMELIRGIIERNAGDDQSIYLQITRGVARRDHPFPKGVAPTVFLMSSPLATPPRAQVENGVSAVTATDFRWLRCDVKSTSLLGNILLKQQGVDNGAAETILFRNGQLTEASSSNVFIVRDGMLLAPLKDNQVLPGITSDVVLELVSRTDIPLQMRDISEFEVRTADEVWVTSSTKEVLAVATLDGKPVGSGKPGPVFKRIHSLYQDYKQTVMRGG